MVFPCVGRELQVSFCCLQISSGIQFSQPYKGHINFPVVFTEAWSSSSQIQSGTNWSQRRGTHSFSRLSVQGQAWIFWSHLLLQREDLGSLRSAQHQFEIIALRGLTLHIFFSTGTSLLWWGEDDVCFGFEQEYIFFSAENKTLIRAWINHKNVLWKHYMLSWKRSQKPWSVYSNIGSKTPLTQK